MSSAVTLASVGGGSLSLWDFGLASSTIDAASLPPQLVYTFKDVACQNNPGSVAGATDFLGQSTWNWDASVVANPIKATKSVILTTVGGSSSGGGHRSKANVASN